MKERVALVTGAARGIGKGAALTLAGPGFTVHLSDRESRNQRHSSLPGTVEDTAREITDRGGTGIAHIVDHADDHAVAAMFVDIERHSTGLNVLVANAFNGNALPFAPAPFWGLSWEHWSNMIDAGVRGHLMTARFAAPLLIQNRGLMMLTGFAVPADGRTGHLFYDLAMNAISRIGLTMSHDLEPHGVSVVTLSPGLTRTEAILAAFGDTPLPAGSQSTDLCGRVISQLMADPDQASFTGRTITVDELAAHYGIDDEPADKGMRIS